MRIAAGGNTPIGLPKKYSERLVSGKTYKHFQNIFKTFFKRFLFSCFRTFLKKFDEATQKEMKAILDSMSQSGISEMPSFASINEGGGRQCPKNLANPPPVKNRINLTKINIFYTAILILILLINQSIFSQDRFDKAPLIEKTNLKLGKVDTLMRLSQNRGVEIKGEVDIEGKIMVEKIGYIRKFDAKKGAVFRLMGEAEKDAAEYEIKEISGQRMVIEAVDIYCKIRKIVIEDGKPLEITYNNGQTGQIENETVARLNIVGEKGELKIERDKKEQKEKGENLEFGFGGKLEILNLKGEPLNYMEIYGVPEYTYRLGWANETGEYKLNYKDTTSYGVVLMKATVRKDSIWKDNQGAYMNAERAYGGAKYVQLRNSLYEIGSRRVNPQERRKPYLLGWWKHPEVYKSEGAYFRGYNPNLLDIRIRGPHGSGHQHDYQQFRHIHTGYAWGDDSQPLSTFAFYPRDEGFTHCVAFAFVIDTKNNNRVYLFDNRLWQTKIGLSGALYVEFDRPKGKTMDTTDGNGFRIAIIRTGDPKLSDSLCIWDVREDYLMNEVKFLQNIMPYEKDSNTVSVKENARRDEILIYPNPVTDMLTIQRQGEGQVNLVITNQLGQTVYKEKLAISEKRKTISVNNLPKGTYYIKITDNKGIIEYQKFIKW